MLEKYSSSQTSVLTDFCQVGHKHAYLNTDRKMLEKKIYPMTIITYDWYTYTTATTVIILAVV